MHKKDFETIAAAIRIELVGARGAQAKDSVAALACRLCSHMADRNPAFRAEQFLSACGLKEEAPDRMVRYLMENA